MNPVYILPTWKTQGNLAEFQEFKQTPTLGRNSISHLSVGIFPHGQVSDARLNFYGVGYVLDDLFVLSNHVAVVGDNLESWIDVSG